MPFTNYKYSGINPPGIGGEKPIPGWEADRGCPGDQASPKAPWEARYNIGPEEG